MMNYFVYIMASQRNGTLYVGVTNDIARRVHEHRTGAADGFTKRYNVKQLVWYETHGDVQAAIAREKSIKRWPRRYKLNVIEAMNPGWNDLYEALNH
jgi:putative endonuclease